MHAAVNRIHFQTQESSDRGLDAWREQIIPQLRQQPGFRGVILMRDAAKERGMGITLWDSESDFQAAVGRPEAQAQIGKLEEEVIAGPPERESYEVMLSEVV